MKKLISMNHGRPGFLGLEHPGWVERVFCFFSHHGIFAENWPPSENCSSGYFLDKISFTNQKLQSPQVLHFLCYLFHVFSTSWRILNSWPIIIIIYNPYVTGKYFIPYKQQINRVLVTARLTSSKLARCKCHRTINGGRLSPINSWPVHLSLVTLSSSEIDGGNKKSFLGTPFPLL